MLRHWVGAGLAVAGVWLLWLAVLRRRLARGATERGEGAPPLHPSLAPMADIGPPIVIFGLFVAGGQVVLAFLATDGGGGVFSLFDLAGFLFLLFAYGVWLKVKVAHRAGARRG